MDKNLKIAIVLSALDKASGVLNKVFSNAEKRAQALDKTAKSFSGIADKSMIGGAAMLTPIVGFVKAAADMEKMQVALTTSFQGNKAAAADAFNTINTFAARTPYALEEAMTAFVKLKNLGLDPSMGSLEAYGNTASAMGKSLDQMIEAVADASTFEFERLKEFGIKANQQGDTVKFTFQGITTSVAKNSKAIETYLKNIGNTKFAGGMEAQSKTVYGQLSTLSDNAKMVAASLGNMLIPRINELFARITPVIDKIQNWISANPELANSFLTTSVALGGGLLAFGGIMKGVSFIISGFSTAMKVATYLGKSFQFVLKAIGIASRFIIANPIVLVIAAIAAAGYLLYRNWDSVVKFFTPMGEFFSRMWTNIKTAFASGIIYISGIFNNAKRIVAGFINTAKSLFLNFTPFGLIIKHWAPLGSMFGKVWDNAKQVFSGALKWVTNLGSMFWNAGANIVNSVWKGMKAMANKPVEAIADITSKIRDYLPFSPSKKGAFRTLHKTKIVETLAQSMKPAPAINAIRSVTDSMFGKFNSTKGAGAGGGTVINFSPVINVSGTATQKDGDLINKNLRAEFSKMMKEFNAQKARVGF